MLCFAYVDYHLKSRGIFFEPSKFVLEHYALIFHGYFMETSFREFPSSQICEPWLELLELLRHGLHGHHLRLERGRLPADPTAAHPTGVIPRGAPHPMSGRNQCVFPSPASAA